MFRRLAFAFLVLHTFGGCNAWIYSSVRKSNPTMHVASTSHSKEQTNNVPINEESSTSTPPFGVDGSRRSAVKGIVASSAALISVILPLTTPDACWAIPTVDVNNAMAREFTAFPGLYPTIATKIVMSAKEKPFKSKKDVYAILNEVEQERLKQYDASIVIAKPDKAVQQFKNSQICKYECGGRASSTFRNEQIKEVQRQRSLDY